jgi:glycerol-1-phosphatase
MPQAGLFHRKCALMISPWLDLPNGPAAEFTGLLVDLDGVVYVGSAAVPHAVEAINEAARQGLNSFYVTNNAARPAAEIAGHLRELGLGALVEQVVTSAQATAELLAGQLPPKTPVLVLGSVGLSAALADVGLEPVSQLDQRPQVLVQGFSPTLDWPQLAQACAAIRAGLRWVATNTDLTLPTAMGPAPGNGSFVKLLAEVTGREPEVVGKPARPLMDTAIQRSGASHPLMIGDRLDTDIAGAVTAGIPGMLVLTGVHAAQALLSAPIEQRPQLLAGDLRDLFRPHPAPVLTGQQWVLPEEGVSCAWTANRGWALTVLGDAAPGRALALAVLRVCAAAYWAQPTTEAARCHGTMDSPLGLGPLTSRSEIM